MSQLKNLTSKSNKIKQTAPTPHRLLGCGSSFVFCTTACPCMDMESGLSNPFRVASRSFAMLFTKSPLTSAHPAKTVCSGRDNRAGLSHIPDGQYFLGFRGPSTLHPMILAIGQVFKYPVCHPERPGSADRYTS